MIRFKRLYLWANLANTGPVCIDIWGHCAGSSLSLKLSSGGCCYAKSLLPAVFACRLACRDKHWTILKNETKNLKRPVLTLLAQLWAYIPPPKKKKGGGAVKQERGKVSESHQNNDSLSTQFARSFHVICHFSLTCILSSIYFCVYYVVSGGKCLQRDVPCTSKYSTPRTRPSQLFWYPS